MLEKVFDKIVCISLNKKFMLRVVYHFQWNAHLCLIHFEITNEKEKKIKWFFSLVFFMQLHLFVQGQKPAVYILSQYSKKDVFFKIKLYSYCP